MLKKWLKVLLVKLLTAEAQAVLRQYQPRLVAVAGSVGKTSAKEAIAAVLSSKYSTRWSDKSYNSEIGVPLSILGLSSAWDNPWGWLGNLWRGWWLARQPVLPAGGDYPEWLVLEVGADRPGDIQKISRWLHPHLAVFTSLPEVPVHMEYFSDATAVADEKWSLAEAVRPDGLWIVNFDDPELAKRAATRQRRLITYGFNAGAEIRCFGVHVMTAGQGDQARPIGLTFKIESDNDLVPFRVRGLVGQHQLYAILAALAVGREAGLNLVELAEVFTEFTPPPGRLRLVDGIKDTLILDDSYNSSPAALTAALKTLTAVASGRRRIAVLGDMLELGRQTIDAHRAAGREAVDHAEVLLGVGVRAKFIVETAKPELGAKQVHHFDDARAAGRALQEMLAPGDVVLVKGSQSMRLERVVEEVMAHPEDKEKLLCRQEPEWQKKM